MRLVEYSLGESVAVYQQVPALPAFDPESISRHRVDSHHLLQESEAIVARASLWWTDVPSLDDERLGVIGHFAAADGPSAALLFRGLVLILLCSWRPPRRVFGHDLPKARPGSVLPCSKSSAHGAGFIFKILDSLTNVIQKIGSPHSVGNEVVKR